MMKSFIPIFLLTTFAVVSCNNNDTKNEHAFSFKLKGTVDHLDNGSIVIMNLHKEGKMDTLAIENGSFSFEGTLDEPTPYLIFAPDILLGQSLFYIDNEKTEIHFDANDPNSLSIKSGQTQKEYERFHEDSKLLLAVLDSLQDPMLQTAENFSMEHLKKRYTETIQQLEKQSSDFIKDNPKSYLSALLAYETVRARTNLSVAEKEDIFNSIDPSIRGSYYAQEIKNMISTGVANAPKEKLPVGADAPNFELLNTQNKRVSLSDYRGKYVLIDFWASWCGPCRKENPHVLAAYKQLKNKNFTIVGVSLDKQKEAWLEAIDKDGLPWDHVSDLAGWGGAVAKQYDVSSIPTNYLVDPNGVIIAKNLRGESLAEQLKTLIK